MRRRLHLQLPSADPSRGAVPVDRRRHLPGPLPGAVRGHAADRTAPQPEPGAGHADRLADPDHRPGRDLVGGADLALRARHLAGTAGQARLDRLPDDGHPAARGRPAAGGGRGTARAELLPAGDLDRLAAGNRLRLQPVHPAWDIQRPVVAGRRLDRVLPVLGRGRPASLDALSRGACARARGEALALAADGADGRLADRARHPGAGGRRSRHRHARHDRLFQQPLPAGRRPHGGTCTPAGALRGARARAARSRPGAGRRHRPRPDRGSGTGRSSHPDRAGLCGATLPADGRAARADRRTRTFRAARDCARHHPAHAAGRLRARAGRAADRRAGRDEHRRNLPRGARGRARGA